MPFSFDANNNLNVTTPSSAPVTVADGHSAATTAVWTSATALNTAISQSIIGYSNIEVSFVPSGLITGGVISFEVSDDNGTTWFPITLADIDQTNSVSGKIFSLSGATADAWQMFVGGFTNFRVRLSTVITGAGTANFRMQASVLGSEPFVQALIVGQTAQGNLIPAKVNPSGTFTTQDGADGPVAPGTAATLSMLSGGVFNSSSPTLTNGQQAAIQFDNNGNLRVNAGADIGSWNSQGNSPAAGLNAKITVPAGTKWKVKAFSVRVVTSAVAGTRTLFMNGQDVGTNILIETVVGVTVGASANNLYSFGPGLPQATAFTSGLATSPFPEIVLGPGGNISTNLNGILAGDTVTLFASVEAYPD